MRTWDSTAGSVHGAVPQTIIKQDREKLMFYKEASGGRKQFNSWIWNASFSAQISGQPRTRAQVAGSPGTAAFPEAAAAGGSSSGSKTSPSSSAIPDLGVGHLPIVSERRGQSILSPLPIGSEGAGPGRPLAVEPWSEEEGSALCASTN